METKEEIRVCPLGICDGSGRLPCIDYVYPGEPHMADIGERPCECSLDEEDDDLDFNEIDADDIDSEEDEDE